MISGIGVFYPDKRPTQRVGIEAAIRQILGPGTPAAVIEKLAKGGKE